MFFEDLAGCDGLVDFIVRKQSLYVYSFSAKRVAEGENVAKAVAGRLRFASRGRL